MKARQLLGGVNVVVNGPSGFLVPVMVDVVVLGGEVMVVPTLLKNRCKARRTRHMCRMIGLYLYFFHNHFSLAP